VEPAPLRDWRGRRPWGDAAGMELLCYLHPGWNPRIRPAEATRPWMDRTPEAFAYRCLPLNIANAHGWEVLSPCSFEAYWLGGAETRDVVLRVPPGVPAEDRPVSLFGNGTVTFHIFGLFRTPPGWNLWVGGSPNRPKDGIQPLTGIIETDWSPYTFTMNWRFTRRGRTVRFEKGEPICFFFPVRRDALTGVEPKLVPMESAPDVMAQFQAWSRSRDAFQAEVARNPPRTPADRWQKRYYRGVDMRDRVPAPDHQAKLRVPGFVAAEAAGPGCPVAGSAARLGEAIGAVAAGIARGEERAALVARLVGAGMGQAEAGVAVEAALRAGGAIAPPGPPP
jgi:hypothetical protein